MADARRCHEGKGLWHTHGVRKVLLIDGHSLAYRAFYALPVENFTTASGQSTNAIYGFASMLINLLDEEKPDQVIAAFDVSRKTFRSDRFPEYKANRAKTPDEFRSQVPLIYSLLEGFNISFIEAEGFEADDLIATLVREFLSDDPLNEIFITTGDRDSFQLVKDKVTVLYPKKGVTDLARMTSEAIELKYGVGPDQYPDFAALRGDASDNLPSIPGVGEKTAAKWLQQYGSLAEIVKASPDIPGKIGQALRDNLEQLQLNRELTQLVDSVPIAQDRLKELVAGGWKGIDREALFRFFTSLEIKTLKDRIGKLPATELNPDPASELGASENFLEESEPVGDLRRIVEISKESARDRFRELVREIVKEKARSEVAIYCDFQLSETDTVFGPTVMIAIAPNENEIYWWRDQSIPLWLISEEHFFGHQVKDMLRRAGDFFRESAEIAEGEFYPPSAKVTFDTELAAYLLNPGSRDLALESLIESELGKPLRLSGDDQSFKPEFAGELWLVRRSLEKKLIEKDLLKLLLEIEIPLLKILAFMEFIGVGFDAVKAEKIRRTFAEENEKLIASAHKLAGREFNVNSPKQLQAVLFDELKLPKTKKIKTGLSTDADSLNWLLSETSHPLVAALLRIREITKLQSVVEGLINSATKNRIRSIFQQAITSTGRLSSTEPNLQNIPVRSEEGRKIRDCFIAESPFISLLTADYSQIEMRIMAHLSKDVALLEAFHSGEDLHATVASQVFGVKPSEVTAEMRRTTKAMSYGLAYGLSAFGLAQQLDLSPNEASDLMKSYFSRFGGIRDYLQSVVSEARDRGFTETLLGRRRYLPDLQSDNRQRREMAERMALNAPIQGSAADIIKLAMLRVERSIQAAGVKSRLILQVHDELIFEVWAGEEQVLEELVRQEMAGAYPLDAELTVNVGIGRSWDEAAH